MYPLPLLQKVASMRRCFGHQTAHVRSFYADARDQMWQPAGSKQVDFRLSRTGNVHMRRLMIAHINNETKAVSTMNDDHRLP
jgi:hypothetical protein